MFNKLLPDSYETFCKDFALPPIKKFNYAFDVIDAMVDANPDQPGIIHIGPDDVRREYPMAWLKQESCRLANALEARGIGKGDRVMLILYRRIEFWVAMLALHRMGAVAVPSPSLLTTKDIVYRVQTGQIKAAIVEDSVASRVQEAKKECPGLSLTVQCGPSPLHEGWEGYDAIMTLAETDYPRRDDTACDDDTLLIYFTSGTTGPPKMVEHTHRYALGHFTTGVYWHDLRPGDIHLTVADTGWGKAVWGKMYGQWMAGATVFVYDFRGKFEPADLLHVMAKHKVTGFCAPPTVYRFLIRQDLSKYDLSSLRHCTTAGELLNESVFYDWKKATGLNIYEGYGQTETTLQIATYPFMDPKPGSIGKPSPGWGIELLDMEGAPCSAGEEGEICISLASSPEGLFTKYIDEPERTANVLHDGYYHTGDKGWMDEDGYIWFLGRVDDLIKSSGYRIGPFEVESALVSHPAVIEAAVTGVPDEQRGQVVKATIVLGHGYTASDALTKEIQNHVKQVTAPYKYPRVVEYVGELPKTISGKIKRAEIRERDLRKC